MLIIVFFNASQMNITEGFTTYNQCIEEGYPMDFCTQTPIVNSIDQGHCSCADGFFGSWHMGEGKCYCYLFDGLLPYKTEQPFESSPF